MNTSLLSDVAVVTGRMLVALVLVIAGLLKLRAGTPWFLQQVLAYDMVRGRAALLLSRVVPALEIACGVLLLFGLFLHFTSAASFILLLMFVVALTSAILRDQPVPCGCFGRTARVSRARWTVVYRNLALMGLLLPVQAATQPLLSVDGLLRRWWLDVGEAVFLDGWLVATWLLTLVVTASLQLLLRQRKARRSKKPKANRGLSGAGRQT